MSYRFRPALGEFCESWDTACVQRNVAASIGGQEQSIVDNQARILQHCYDDANRSSEPFRSQLMAQCDVNNRVAMATVDTPQQAVQNYYAHEVATDAQVRAELARAGQTPDTIKQLYGAPMTIPAGVVSTPATVQATAAGTNPQGATVVNSSGPPNTPGTVVTLPAVGGTNLPWWVWAGGAAAVLFMFKGGR